MLTDVIQWRMWACSILMRACRAPRNEVTENDKPETTNDSNYLLSIQPSLTSALIQFISGLSTHNDDSRV